MMRTGDKKWKNYERRGSSVSKEIRSRFPEKFSKFLDYISIDESEFWKTIDKFRPDHLWTKEKLLEIKHTFTINVYDK